MEKSEAVKIICPILSANNNDDFIRCQTDRCMAWVSGSHVETSGYGEETKIIETGYCKIIFPDGDEK